jgi:competence protein ComEC
MLPLLGPSLALMAGILVSPYLEPHSVWVCIPPTVLLCFVRRWCLVLLFALLGAGLRSLEPPVPPEPGDVASRIVCRVLRPPEWRGLGVYLDVEVLTVDDRPYRGRARLTEFLEDAELRALFETLRLGSGDRAEIVVRLHRPATYRNPGVFDYRRYLERQQIYWTGTIRNPRLITVLDRGWHGLDRIRRWTSLRLEEAFIEDATSQGIILGMVLGRKYVLTAPTERQFQAGGLYHLLVVSGFNLAVVAAAASWIANRFPCNRSTRLVLVLASALGYTTLVEGQAPVMRALLMVCFLLVGKLLDRGHAVGNSIAGAAIIILLLDPTAIEDSSFQMTFAAVVAVAGIGIPATKWGFGWLRQALNEFGDVDRDNRLPVQIADWRVSRRLWCELRGVPYWAITAPWRIVLNFGEAAIVSLCVEAIFVYFMVESFHRMSPISPLLNVPAGFIAALVTPLGLAIIVLPQPIRAAAAFVVRILIGTLTSVLDFALSLPYSTIRVPSAPHWLWLAYAACLVFVVAAIHRQRTILLALAAMAAAGLQTTIALADFSPAARRDTRIIFLDVGQGDSELVELADGRRILIDGGGVAAGRFLGLRDDSTFSIGENVVSAYLFGRGIRKIDIVVLTHAHNDHLDGLLDVVGNFQVGEIWLGRNPMIPPYRRFIEIAQQKQIPLRWISTGQMFGPFTVLHPPADWRVKRNAENNDSVVLLLKSGGVTALLTGDIERSISAPQKVDVLKVPHHGSKNAKLRLHATVRVISVGSNNPFGHPHPSTLPALRTDRLGAIAVTLSRPPIVRAINSPP